MPESAEIKVSIVDVEPVRDLLVAGVRLYDALYHMPGAADFFTKTASRSVCESYVAMGTLVRRSSLAVVQSSRDENEETA